LNYQKNPFMRLLFFTKHPVTLLLFTLFPSFFLAFFYSLSHEKDFLSIREEEHLWLEFIVILSLTIIFAFIIAKIGIKRNILLYILTMIIAVINVAIMLINGYFITETFFRDKKALYLTLFALFGFFCSIIWFLTILLYPKVTKMRNFFMAIISVNLGSILTLIFPIIFYLVIIIIMSIFDIYSVFKGPIKTIFGLPQQKVYNITRTIGLGFGDLVFYSSLVVFFTMNYGMLIGFYSIINIIVGVKLTVKLVRKYARFPGLPLPTIITIMCCYLGLFLSRII